MMLEKEGSGLQDVGQEAVERCPPGPSENKAPAHHPGVPTTALLLPCRSPAGTRKPRLLLGPDGDDDASLSPNSSVVSALPSA